MNYTAPKTGSGFYFAFGAEGPSSDASSRLADAVMQRISAARLRQTRIAAGLYGLVSLLGLSLFVFSISYTYSFSLESGFSQYLSLIATEGANLAGSWKAVVLSIIESAPLMGTTLILAAILVSGFSFMRFMSDIKHIKSHRYAIL